MRILALDIGDKHTGVAVSDAGKIIASPHSVIRSDQLPDLIRELKALKTELEIDELVVGLPRSLSGAVGSQAERTLEKANMIGEALGLEVHFMDERFTSLDARRFISAGHGDQKDEDMVSAALILQGFIEQRTSGK